MQFYKEHGGTDFLELFRINQAKLIAEEEQRLAELQARQSNKTQLGGGFNTYRTKTGTVSTLKTNIIFHSNNGNGSGFLL